MSTEPTIEMLVELLADMVADFEKIELIIRTTVDGPTVINPVANCKNLTHALIAIEPIVLKHIAKADERKSRQG